MARSMARRDPPPLRFGAALFCVASRPESWPRRRLCEVGFSPYLWRFSRLFPFFSLANTGKLESAIAIGEKDDDEIDLACRDWRLFGFKSISALAE
jgi:hypothetical protein